MSAQKINNYEVKAGLATIDSFNVVGVSAITTNKNGQAAEDINALWERFFSESIGQKITDKESDIIYAVYSDYEGDHEHPYRVTIGYKTKSIVYPQGDHGIIGKSITSDSMHTVHIEPGEYGVMSATGSQPQALMETWEAIWSSDLNREFKTDFEVYGPRFFEDGINEVLVHIGLSTRNEKEG